MRAPTYSNLPDELLSPSSIHDPHALYARLRRTAPLSRVSDTGVHLVVTWSLIEEVLSREADFSANLTGVLVRGVNGLPAVFPLPNSAGTRVIATADDPAHAVHRAIVRPRLTGRLIGDLESPVRSWAAEGVAAWLRDGAGDFIPLAERIPARAVARILGLPEEDVDLHRTWSMMGGDMLAGDVSIATMKRLAQQTSKMAAYLNEHFEIAAASPNEAANAPLLHALGLAFREGKISTEEAVGIATVMFGAGGESTAALIGSMVRWLAEDTETAQRLRSDPSLIPSFIEEVARLEPPFKFHYRVVRHTTELGGFDLAPGDRLLLVWASANRDPSRIDDPDLLRLDRPYPRDHISFGRGMHFCVGAALARLEARILCEELLSRTKDLAVADADGVAYVPSIFVRRLHSLRLRATPADTVSGPPTPQR